MDVEDKYLVLTAGKGNPVPQVVKWYGKIDVRKINRRDYRQLSEYFLLDMRTGRDVVYPDILTDPVLMVSAEVREVIHRYDTELPFLFVALLDEVSAESAVYYCPILAEGEDAAEHREVLYRADTPKGSEIRIRLDLAESLLWRGAVGMELREIEV